MEIGGVRLDAGYLASRIVKSLEQKPAHEIKIPDGSQLAATVKDIDGKVGAKVDFVAGTQAINNDNTGKIISRIDTSA